MNTRSATHAFVSAYGDGQPLPGVGRVRVSAAQTGDAFEVIELTPQGKGPPAHIHHGLDECFVILEGDYKFVLGRQEIQARPGAVVFVPRGTRHFFTHSEGSRALVFTIPAGLEGFFRELTAGIAAGRTSTEMRLELAHKYDSEPVE